MSRKAKPTTKPPQSKVTYFNMGPWPFYCALATSERAFLCEMKRLKVKDTPFQASEHATATAHWITREGKAAIGMIALVPDPDASKPIVAARVAHEALHLVQALRCLVNAAQPLDDESEAYLVQYIVGRCLDELWETGMVPGVKAS